MEISIILDKTHHFLIECKVNPELGKESYILPEDTPSLLQKWEKTSFEFHFLAKNLSFHISDNPSQEINIDIILLKGQKQPAISEKGNYQWLSLPTFTETLIISSKDAGPISIPATFLRKVYFEGVLQGYSLDSHFFDVWHFCNNETDANELAELVRAGTKRATASLHDIYEFEHEEIPKPGNFSVVTDFDGIPQVILQTTRVDIIPFDEVTPTFARIEGEGDKSLEYWQRVHRKFFTEEGEYCHHPFTPKSRVVCEQFTVVKDLRA